jgi:hypothetical protein
MRMPLPVAPETWKPARAVVKMARPWARAITLEGMVRRTLGFLVLWSACWGLGGALPAAGAVGMPLAPGAVGMPLTAGAVGGVVSL